MSDDLTSIRGIAGTRARQLQNAGIRSFADLRRASLATLRTTVSGVSDTQLKRWQQAAAALAAEAADRWVTDAQATVRFQHRSSDEARVRTIAMVKGKGERSEWSGYEFTDVAEWLRRMVRSRLAAQRVEPRGSVGTEPGFDITLADLDDRPLLGPRHVWSARPFDATLSMRPEVLVGVPTNQISLALVDVATHTKHRVGWVQRMKSEPEAVAISVRCSPVPHGTYRVLLDLGDDEVRAGPVLMAV